VTFLLHLSVLLLTAKVFGEICERLNYPSVLGYLGAGLFLGPVFKAITGLAFVPVNYEISVFGELGAILLLFIAGLGEPHIERLLKNKIATVGSALLGYLFPFIGVLFVASFAYVIDPSIIFSYPQILVLVIATSCTSIMPSMRVLIQEEKMNTETGRAIIRSGVLTDLAGLTVFMAFLSYLTVGSFGLENILSMILFTFVFVVVFLIGERIVPILVNKSRTMEVEEAEFTTGFVVMLALVYLASILGFHGIIGAFFAGMIITKTSLKGGRFTEKISSLSYGIFVPIFFAWAGLMFTPPISWVFVFLVILAALSTNIFGAWFGAWLGNIKPENALVFGVGMMPRGGVDLVIITAAKNLGVLEGFYGELVYSTVILLALVSMIISPVILRSVLRQMKEEVI